VVEAKGGGKGSVIGCRVAGLGIACVRGPNEVAWGHEFGKG
jgi:hypothetical protein